MMPIGTTLKLKYYPVVTIYLIAINCFVHIPWMLFSDMYDYQPEICPLTEYIISLFSVFLHGDIYHLLGNMFFLWVFGSYLEDKTGSKRFLFYYFICEIGAVLLHLMTDGRPSIGASGAISGVMGIYLVRCYYSKIKTTVPLFLLYCKVNVHALWLMAFWILGDVIDALSVSDFNVHWAHIGGYVTGIAIGIINNYWTEAKRDHLYERAMTVIGGRWGLDDAEKYLLKVLRIAPGHTDAHV